MPARKKKTTKGSGAALLEATEVAEGTPPAAVRALADDVRRDGGVVLATYREPFGAHWVLFVSLPFDKVEATPYQRELSPAHAKRLAEVIPKVGRFLDPVIATRQGDRYWTPNGMHRLAALESLGAKAVLALLIPEPEITYRILSLNVEKAHALKDKALEVIRMARGIAAGAAGDDVAKRPESAWTFEFEDPAYLTLGICYERRPRYSGGAYFPMVHRCEEFSDARLGASLGEREVRATQLLELDDAVVEIVARLKEQGLKSAYLKPFVVARLNPLRFARAAKPGQPAPRASFTPTVTKMLEAARRFDAKKVRPQDLAGAAAYGGAGEEASV